MLGASAASGVKLATVPAAFSATLPDTGLLPLSTWKFVEPVATGRSKPTETVVPSGTPVALAAGDCDVTVGGIEVANDHDAGSIVAPTPLVAPDTATL